MHHKGKINEVICQPVPIDKVQLGDWEAREAGAGGVRIEVRKGFQKEALSTEYW